MTSVLIRDRKEDTQRRTQCKNEGKNWNNVATVQGRPMIADNYQKLGESHGMDSSLESYEGVWF
jgi:hypothetical protein